jgi:hypothetical protein
MKSKKICALLFFDVSKYRRMPRTSRKSRRASRRAKSRPRSRSRSGSGQKVTTKPKARAPQKTKKKSQSLSDKTLSELQMIARSHGIPFGGLTRTQLLEKIIAYQ